MAKYTVTKTDALEILRRVEQTEQLHTQTCSYDFIRSQLEDLGYRSVNGATIWKVLCVADEHGETERVNQIRRVLVSTLLTEVDEHRKYLRRLHQCREHEQAYSEIAS